MNHKSYNISNSYRIQTPYMGFNLMKEKTIKTDITKIGFHFIGPIDKLYEIKNYYERTI